MLKEIEVPRGDPLYSKTPNITITEVQKHRRLHNWLIQYWRYYLVDLDFSPDVNNILRFVPSLCFVPCFFLAYTCCRVNELKQIKLSSLQDSKPFKIKASKSKTIRSLPALTPFKYQLLQSIDPKTQLFVISYDHLKNAIRCAKLRSGIKIETDRHDLTHIFRHLTATYKHNQGVEDSVLSDMLGHMSKESLRSYIH